ncbi:DUF1727 domain-containing protein [Bifidobacterium pullorum subsp. saeculare]|uniref:Lipid II isoglutaminyl synthase (glutamine-hydrolyzing) subunit MurT n=1 Tax=Bifidobacterium pullorum subsp. saeculare TaxID=78257 RepID=A0A938X0R8_9BIFI|nr:Mur ligase family protein [Bifidobacterium pullorum]MBM6700197.1 DUF1727 domain-containing protein [Bifidobacterium pullorum subsp. saeculare]
MAAQDKNPAAPATAPAAAGRTPFSFATPALGKAVRWAARAARRGGSAFPGKVVESVDPGFLARTLGQLPLGVVLVSGTNGKTTTTRMVATMLSDLGLKVFTNPTGSNFTRGVVSALLAQVDLSGRLDADIAVLELDEAYAVHFVAQVRPRYCLLLNVMRDQLDRFGEIDNTARLLAHVAEATTGTVVLNREDPRIAALAAHAGPGAAVRWFGLAPGLRSFFPSDDDMAVTGAGDAARADRAVAGALAHDGAGGPEPAAAAGRRDPDDLPADVVLTEVGDHRARFRIGGVDCGTDVRLEGVYNLYNAAGALAVVRAVLDGSGDPALTGTGAGRLMEVLATVTPAFGRGEVIDCHGTPVELVLVKNPMGFRLSLASFDPAGSDTMIAINDEYADGRDMSWLWDVDFTSLRAGGVAMVSGVRAWDMALRLGYDQVAAGAVEPALGEAVERFVALNPGRPKRIYVTYTAMLKVRQHLSQMTDVADAGVGR